MIRLSDLPSDYYERVYAGILGKIIGVYLGRPFEQCSHEDIDQRLGEIWYYVHDRLGQPLIVADDDISGTFTFVRALEDYGYDPGLTPKQIGQTWLNYIIENRTILWWGGMGSSTEHTAYLRLKKGIPAPESGSAALNTTIVAEQIGAQIFIDAWGLLNPNDPGRAADFARRAGSVSHDGEAIYGAQVVAAMVAAAFTSQTIDQLLDTGLSVIPADSQIARLIAEIREWHSAQPNDWRATRQKIADKYGYDKFGGGCHMVPNHALIIHSLLHGEGDFQKSLMIVNTSGWDTDCNSGNVGCILGVLGGLSGLESGPDFRGPVADRLLLPTADGGRCVSDALAETDRILLGAHKMRGLDWKAPKSGAKFHFSLPGATQGWTACDSPGYAGALVVENSGQGSLRILAKDIAHGRPGLVSTPTFASKEQLGTKGYTIAASPTLYPGHEVRALLSAPGSNQSDFSVSLCIRHFNAKDELTLIVGPVIGLQPGEDASLEWTIPDTGGWPIAEIGLLVSSESRAEGEIILDSLTWTGAPTCIFRAPLDAPKHQWGTEPIGRTWRQCWVNGLDLFEWWDAAYRCTQNSGTGLAITGCREWRDYTASAKVSVHMAESAGIAARVQGMKRWYGLLLVPGGKVQLVKELDGRRVLAQAEIDWQLDRVYDLSLTVVGSEISGSIDGVEVVSFTDQESLLDGGGVAFVVEEGRLMSDEMRVVPLG